MFSEREQAYQTCLLLIPCGNGGITLTQGIQGADEPGAQRGDSVPVGYVVMPTEHADEASAGQGMVKGGVGCHVCRALLGGGKPAVRFLMVDLRVKHTTHKVVSARVEQVIRKLCIRHVYIAPRVPLLQFLLHVCMRGAGMCKDE